MRPIVLQIHERPLTLVKFVHDGDFFMTSGKDGAVNLIRTEDAERIGTYSSSGAVYAVDCTVDCEYVVTAGADGKVVFYTFEGEFKSQINHGGILKWVEWNGEPGNQNKVVTCNDKFKSKEEGVIANRIMIWQFDPVARLLCIEDNLPMKANKVRWGAFDETLLAIFDEGTIIQYCARTGDQLGLVQAHSGPVQSINFSEDKMLMISASKDQTAKLWAMDDFNDDSEPVKVYKADRPLNDAAISPLYSSEQAPKYHVLLAGGQDAKDVTTTSASSGRFETSLWNMIFEEEIGSVKGHFGPVNTLAWFRDGRGFVTGGEDGFVRVNAFDSDYLTSKKYD